MKIELMQEQIDKIVLDELVWHLGVLSDPKNDPYETFDNRVKYINGFCEVIRAYTTQEEYDEIIKNLGKGCGV
jgi:hypothetical protein